MARKKKTVNVAMVGAQFMGKTHSNAWRKVGMFFDMPAEPVMKVLCGKFEEEVQVAEKWGWEETSIDWKKTVARGDIDIIDICTPNFLHAPIAEAAAKAGKHVICEKPLANTLPEAKSMLKAVSKADIKHMCGFSYRFVPAIQTIKNTRYRQGDDGTSKVPTESKIDGRQSSAKSKDSQHIRSKASHRQRTNFRQRPPYS